MNNKKVQKRTIDEKKLLTQDFDKPIVLITYSGNQVIKKSVQIKKYDLLIDKETEIPKLSIMFVFPYSQYETIHKKILLNKKVESLNLQMIEKLSDRPKVATPVEYIKGTKKIVTITMRTGHVLTGRQIWASKYHILLDVDKQKVLIYKHGIYTYQTDRPSNYIKPDKKVEKE